MLLLQLETFYNRQVKKQSCVCIYVKNKIYFQFIKEEHMS